MSKIDHSKLLRWAWIVMLVIGLVLDAVIFDLFAYLPVP